MIPADFIQDLLNRVDVVDVVGRYVQLKKGGANFMGLCPFHNEKSPSFTVSPTKQFYHCFGCGVHGNAIGFLMEYQGLSFVEAVKDLAQSVGMTVPEVRLERDSGGRPKVDKAQSTSLLEIMAAACQFYRKELRAAQAAVQYLKGRGLTGEIAAHFALGYAPDDWRPLAQVFSDYEQPLLVEAGLVIAGDNNKRYDRFRGRVMFPIRNLRGQVIGFGGRVLDGGEPKYLNSPETPLFSKGSELYGLFEARQAIRERGFVIVVEGYMDVVALAQLGFPNAVATLGTATTPIHVQKLLRQTDQVIFSFDGDQAGRKAAWRALEAALPHAADNKQIRFLFLPPEHDPDSYVREEGVAAFESQLSQALPLSRFLVSHLQNQHDVGNAEGRAHLLYDAKPLLLALPAGALRLQVMRDLAQITDSAPAEIEALVGIKPNGVRPGAARRSSKPVSRRLVSSNIERLVVLLLGHPDWFARLTHPQRSVMLQDPALAALLAVVDGLSSATSPTLASLSQHLSDQPAGIDWQPFLLQAASADTLAESELEPEISGALRNIERQQLEAAREQLAKALASSQQLDAEAVQRFRQLEQQISALKRMAPPAV
ncbi:DNA primase [Parvibium lacunae]|uniref:DNA primase n=1 Tax=Parvibium lacunae TaxID=1888893 RepID=A0A368L4K1_9BURK|nr:DNA primase [Parvibium lacunae]RCS58445.1 DNA primase [Parvibium lacunae]